MNVPFLDLRRETLALRNELEQAVAAVLDSGLFILDGRVADFEAAFARFCGVDHCVGVASGTDALTLALSAGGVGSGDEVIAPAFGPVATVAAISASGAKPVLADVANSTLTLDPGRLEDSLSERTRAIVPVHLYGQPAEMDPILAFARSEGLLVVEDAAQAVAAEYRGVRAGTIGDAGAFSFYPTKNLGALGDGGAVVTNDAELAGRVRLLRAHGADASGQSQLAATNSRLDELQAAILSAKLPHLEERTARRRQLAALYREGLAEGELVLPHETPESRHVFHLFAVRSRERDRLGERLESSGVETRVHYPWAIHQHPAYAELAQKAEGLQASERAALEVVSLPLYPELTDAELEAVIDAVTE